MLTVFSQKCAHVVRNLLPLETAIVLLLLSAVIWPVPYFGDVSPMLVIVAIYYWAIYRPDLFRPSLAFALGLMNDLLNYFPFGLSAFVFVLIYQLAYSQRRLFVRQSFFMVWSGFGVLAFVGIAANWAALSLWNGVVMPLVPILIQFGFTVILFPVPAWILIRLQKSFLSTGEV